MRKQRYKNILPQEDNGKAEADGVMKKIASISKENHLLPILQYKWLPMDSLSDMLVMWMPLAETVGVEIEWGELRYKSIVQQSGREYMENYISLGMDIAKALKVLHDEGLVHHDVKPENFFYMENRGKVSGYLGDYDSVKPKEMQYKGRVTGTGAYMAPEVRAGKPYSYDSDIYSWGRTMFSLLEGRILKKDDNIAFKFEDDGAYLYINGSYTRSFREYINSEYYKLIRIIARAIDPEPRRRYAGGSALLEALERIGVASEEEQLKNEEAINVSNPVLVSSKAKEENETKKIAWVSGCYEAIEKVYEKAKENDFASKTMLELETGALAEAKAHAGMIRIVNKPITPEQYDGISDIVKESLMSALGDMGISEFRAPLTEPKIVVRLSAQIQQVRCCTAFSVLNRLEQLEASYKSLHPQAKMEIQAPLGGKKGLMQIEMLIAVLYPWLNVSEVSTNELAISESN